MYIKGMYVPGIVEGSEEGTNAKDHTWERQDLSKGVKDWFFVCFKGRIEPLPDKWDTRPLKWSVQDWFNFDNLKSN